MTRKKAIDEEPTLFSRALISLLGRFSKFCMNILIKLMNTGASSSLINSKIE